MEESLYPQLRILHLEDNPEDRELIRRWLSREGVDCQLTAVQDRADFLDALDGRRFDLVLADNALPGFDGLSALQMVRDRHPDVPFIFVTGSMGEESAIETIRNGATDYVLKDRLSRLSPAIKRAVNEARQKEKGIRMVEALLESENRFRVFMDNSAFVAYIKDEQGRFVYANRRLEEVVNCSNGEILGKTCLSFFPEPEAKRASEIDCEVLRTGKPRETTEVLSGRDGRLHHWLISRFPIRESAGRLLVAGTALDITERLASERRIEEQAALLDKAQDAICVCTLDGVMTYWNRGAERVYGWAQAEAIGRSIHDLLWRHDPTRFRELQQQVQEKEEWAGELSQFTKTEKPVVLQSRWTLVKDDAGVARSILMINTDISEKKELEAQFLRAQRMESIGILAGGIAHDLNNVLAPILMVSQLLRLKTNDQESLEWLDTLESSAKHGADLIKQVLAFARGLGGERTEMQVGHLLRDMQKILRETLPRSIEIQSRIPKDLWLIPGVVTQLHQVLMNLCVNARDAMPQGGRIELTAQNVMVDETYAQGHPEAKPGPYIMIAVSDTGTGIPPELIQRIYEPFFTTKGHGQGTGLGLSTVQNIAKSHGGFVHVYSEQGKGTTFKVYFPAVLTGSLEESEFQRASLPRGRGECILVVDDEEQVRALLKATLEKYNYHILTANDGAEGLAVYVQHRDQIELVLSDLMMPLMEGRAMIRALKKLDPHVKIIALSGMLDPGAIDDTPELGTIELMQKPFSTERLLMSVQRTLQSNRS